MGNTPKILEAGAPGFSQKRKKKKKHVEEVKQ
jgi:hypothetical protein